MFEITKHMGEGREQWVGKFRDLKTAREFAAVASKDEDAEYIVRGPNEPHGIVFLQAIYRDGVEVEDA